ncbi:MAG: bifunctional precorrin-2 dehydrogenase/sirohydrochlorin ferrochelatase [Nitrospiraceae bacterium]|nr:bifunctional precorrin-2 dehydrogenase/sirohydrochlorin ferrochelatase [Nitrospiraceae bacterium]
MRLYPLALKIDGRRCVVVGGGRVAERKVASLNECGAEVVVVSPELTLDLGEMASRGEIEAVRRVFEPADLESAVLAIAATDDTAVNEAVLAAGRTYSVLVNVVDVPELCDFYVPASVNRGDLQITISSSGACPALSRQLRRRLSAEFGPEYEPYLRLLNRLRRGLIERVAEPARRKEMLNELLASPALGLLAEGAETEAERVLEERFDVLVKGEQTE